MSVLSDIQHLRENGIWPSNTVPAWALALGERLGEAPDSLAVQAEALFAAAKDARADAVAARQALANAQSAHAAELEALRSRLRLRAFARQAPPVGVTLFLRGTGTGGIGRWRADSTLNVLWSAPDGLTLADFTHWLALPPLFTE